MSRRILVVEDQADNRQILNDLLASVGYEIVHAENGEEALAAASDQDDLVPFQRLLDALRRPYDDADELAPYAEAAPVAVTACYRTFCGT